MPLLQGQPFKLIKDPEINPLHSEIFKIPHTGEKFLSKSDYEDRLALYSQTIWTCQSTGLSGLTHDEAWTSEAKAKLSLNSLIATALQKPLLALVHHSLSPLEQLVDAASILCHSQFHVGEKVILNPKQILVRVIASNEAPKHFSDTVCVVNGVTSDDPTVNGSENGLTKESPGISPGKENQTKDKFDCTSKKEMLPKLYDLLVMEDNSILEKIHSKFLQRPYKVPSKDQIRLFIRSSALRQRGASCTPWVVSEELVDQFALPNKLPTVFLSSPKLILTAAAKRKSHSPIGELSKRPKQELNIDQRNVGGPKKRLDCSKTVAPLVLKSENYRKSIFNIVKAQTVKQDEKSYLPLLKTSPEKNFSEFIPDLATSPKDLNISPRAFGIVATKHPLSMGKPKILPKSSNYFIPKTAPLPGTGNVPKRRGRPPLTKEEKERNKRMRQASLFELSKKTATECQGKLMKMKTNAMLHSPGTSSSYLTSPNPLMNCPYKSPVKRATTPESIMKLPFMRRFSYEHKTIKGVIGQFRRLSHTMDIVLGKLSEEQINMIPDEGMKQDLMLRQKKVQDKKFIEKLTPEERKKFMKDKARTVALERWKERKLKNLKIEDKTLNELIPLPQPEIVETPKNLPNASFGDAVMLTEFIRCFRELFLGEENFVLSSKHLMDALCMGPHGFKTITDILCILLPTIVHDDISKNCKELGVPIAGIPINYQTAPELARLCLRPVENDDALEPGEDSWQIGKEKVELCDTLLLKMEKCEFWDLTIEDIIAVIKALVNKVLATAALSVYVEEIEDNVLQNLREKRNYFKKIQKEKQIKYNKRKEQRQQNKEAKTNQPKKARGRPKGYSPKIAALNMREFLNKQASMSILPAPTQIPVPVLVPVSLFSIPATVKEEVNPVAAVQQRRLSAENLKKEKEEKRKQEKERLKQQEEDLKRQAVEKRYDEIVNKRDNLLRRQPIGLDRDHNRYWLFHSTTPGLFVEKGWVDTNTSYNCYETTKEVTFSGCEDSNENKQIKVESSDEDEKPLSIVFPRDDEDSPLKSNVVMDQDEDDKPLAQMDKSKLSITPMKMSCRGRPPKEAYVLVDEDTQTFPTIEANRWFQYRSMEEVDALVASLSDKGQRESQLIAALHMNREILQNHFAIKQVLSYYVYQFR